MNVFKFVEHAITSTNLTFCDEDLPNLRLQLAKKLRPLAVKTDCEDDHEGVQFLTEITALRKEGRET